MSRKKKPAKRPYRTPAELMAEKRIETMMEKVRQEFHDALPMEPAPEVIPMVQVQPEPQPAPRRGATPKAKKPAQGSSLLLTVNDLCGLLNLSRSTINRMERNGTLPGRVELGGAVRYHRETVEAWLRGIAKNP
ncbi:helix-turn-helix transcriptional regulator [Trichlorobacter ammonificans]|uniref:HTH_17 domain-containing protein n=1 Tax=Trichlorobacter ammonificans TaxID=2916410 RepID=A0ABM9DA63_9BACT|nr:helix-turn-helix domain-containing protein [Trichlorobacter ammonificans]CAH2031260.1 HTH_17 domain-containing protein [Trichlorobacter ammonificans]